MNKNNDLTNMLIIVSQHVMLNCLLKNAQIAVYNRLII